MSELLQRQHISVDVENDIVVFRLAKHVARFSYGTAFLIAQRLRLAANVAGRAAGISPGERSEMKREAPHTDEFEVAIGGGKVVNAGLRWNVWNEGELVCFQFGDLIARWQAPAAMQIAAWFREGGRQAKLWAGDTSKTLSLAGVLTDANANANLKS